MRHQHACCKEDVDSNHANEGSMVGEEEWWEGDTLRIGVCSGLEKVTQSSKK